MVPKHYSATDGRSVYWSLQFPSYFESTPKPKKGSRIVDDLKAVKILLERFREAVINGKILIISTAPFYEFIKKSQFDFFHSDSDGDEGIRRNSEMPKEDKTLILCEKKFGRRTFSEVSPFSRGCVRITVCDK